MNINEMQKKVSIFLKKTGRFKIQSPSINQMTIVLLIYRGVADTHQELANEMGRSYDSVRRLCQSLRNGSSADRSGYEFLDTRPIPRKSSNSDALTKLVLTPDGRKFAKIIAPFFGD